jgi:hypothetical protein
MSRTWVMVVAVAVLGGLLVGVVWAATGYKLECLNAKCGYKGECQLGPTKLMDSIDGYCAACDKWVNLRWKRAGGEAPKPIGKVWAPDTGKTISVYACPNCKGPFAPVTDEDVVKETKYATGGKPAAGERFMHCPKCGEPSLKMQTHMFLD